MQLQNNKLKLNNPTQHLLLLQKKRVATEMDPNIVLGSLKS